MLIRTINVKDLTKLIKDKALIQGKNYQVVDVRDQDYEGGHIVGSVNLPAHTIPGTADDLVKKFHGIQKLIFHCLLCQVRGPKAARIYGDAVDRQLAKEENPESSPLAKQEVYFLEGGFMSWLHEHKESPGLIVDYDPEFWKDEQD
ncbi:Cdc25 phosphatase Ibp1 [Mycoemilia scoparia]|uniref:Cdc25 phosphatase Ibp1 n=1 Tax=Mycoemilia scoparia TaxID=417184 RepID=A0A9W8A1U3_9FUNG|nr:Cdc25 phosphatase Ibp1 [Mycoemilia scoparia]